MLRLRRPSSITGVAFQQFIGSLTGKKTQQIAESNAPNRLQTCSEMTELAESTPTVMAELMIRVESLFTWQSRCDI